MMEYDLLNQIKPRKSGKAHGLPEKNSTYALAALVWPYLSVRSWATCPVIRHFTVSISITLITLPVPQEPE